MDQTTAVYYKIISFHNTFLNLFVLFVSPCLITCSRRDVALFQEFLGAKKRETIKNRSTLRVSVRVLFLSRKFTRVWSKIEFRNLSYRNIWGNNKCRCFRLSEFSVKYAFYILLLYMEHQCHLDFYIKFRCISAFKFHIPNWIIRDQNSGKQDD